MPRMGLPSESFADQLADHVRVVQGLAACEPVLGRVADRLIALFRAGGRLFLAGNGGSAADAQHIAAELTGRFKRQRAALPAIALTTDTSALTAIGNDFSFEQIFARQVEALLRTGDALWVLSTSGNSPNILAAITAARRQGGLVIGFSGRSGGRLAGVCDELLCVPHERSDRIQEAHLLAYHYVCDRVEAAFAD
jgi:D-sedoheptulose 7-phosphate isomerase